MPIKQPEIPDPGPSSLPDWVDVTEAKKEEKGWPALDSVRQRNDGWWLTVYGIVVVVITAVFSLLFVASLVIWSLHYLLPESYGWLSEAQLSKVQSILFSGGMGAIVSTIVQKQLSKSEPQR